MKGLDTMVDDRDFALIRQDRLTFSVLHRILQGPCDLILTDHRRLLLCHSQARYPVWIWTPDGAGEADRARAWEIARAARPLTEGFRYNLKYELAEAFLARAKAQGVPAGIAMNLLAYDCPAPVPPAHSADGGLHVCTEKDTAQAAWMIGQFHEAIGDGPADPAFCRARAAEYIAGGRFFFWKNGRGEPVACCSFRPDGELASVGSVLTLPAYRRRHYAENLVYRVACLAAEKGLLPALYTDGDYAASNACYEKIGFVRRGGLCTLALCREQEV